MSFIRGAGIVIIGAILFLGLIFAGLIYTFQNSLEYENLKGEVGNVLLENMASNQQLVQGVDSAIPYLQEYCKTHSSYTFNSELSDLKVDVSCGSIRAGKQAIVDEMVNESLSQVYYQKYDCEFVDCLNQDKPLYLISGEFKGYLMSKFYFVLLALIVLSVLMFFLVEHKANYFLISGALIIIAGLPFLVLKSIFFFMEDYLYGVTNIFLSTSRSTFVGFLIIGIIFLIVGIVWKLFIVGFKISAFFSRHKNDDEKDEEDEEDEKESISKKDVKEIVKKEVSKNEIKEIVKQEISKNKNEDKIPSKEPNKKGKGSKK